MPEQIKHERPPEQTVEVHLGALLVQVADAVEGHVEDAVGTDIAGALALRHHPGDIALAQLTNRLLTHCATLANGVTEIPESDRSPRGHAVLETWAKLQEDGPADGPLGSWSYPRHLALTARDMLQAIHDHRHQTQVHGLFVGHRNMPPLAPSDR
ncbi:hypothetical protein [Streptomyces sp. NBC_00094]|uniref:hypothetical protein n=1 Tax=Streptomyces sp. NBC_00094 TaxID=2903620 RepID=UPI002250B524|nr:hypothetical protein [Streptomyces sp. NBC_00094]MCX5390437.1 hypothetical protein [Streptomyces sp. NBC_00094]